MHCKTKLFETADMIVDHTQSSFKGVSSMMMNKFNGGSTAAGMPSHPSMSIKLNLSQGS